MFFGNRYIFVRVFPKWDFNLGGNEIAIFWRRENGSCYKHLSGIWQNVKLMALRGDSAQYQLSWESHLQCNTNNQQQSGWSKQEKRMKVITFCSIQE